jgi:hypothetical protein
VEFFRLDQDKVIEGYVIAGASTYEEALTKFFPLIGRLDIQRDALKTKFYSRLELDIVRGCVMPPITIALIHSFDQDPLSIADAASYIEGDLENGFVLDGIQRLNTLQRASKNIDFDPSRPLHVNFVIANSRDRLLYRMITLNNGQKAMSARHQIEVLADSFFEFNEMGLKLVPEKGGGRVRAPDTFKKSDFIKGYIAYLSESVSIDNQKIIEEKMDELIASRIIDSDIPTRDREFTDIVQLVEKVSANDYLRDWIRGQNNFIGFCVGARKSIKFLQGVSLEEMEESIKSFEQALLSVNVSKVNLGKVRRESVSRFIQDFEENSGLDEFNLLNKISDWI